MTKRKKKLGYPFNAIVIVGIIFFIYFASMNDGKFTIFELVCLGMGIVALSIVLFEQIKK